MPASCWRASQANVELARSRRHTAEVLRDEARRLRVLNRTANTLAAEIELEHLVQSVTDAATELTGAQFGAFFYNVVSAKGESYLLYTISGVPKERFANFSQPRNTAVFGPTFAGQGIVRSGDIRKDPRYGHNAPHRGIPEGHLPVVSYLAVPVASPSGEVLGGLFFGHAEADRFTEHHELIVAGIASQAATAFEKARLYEASRKAEADLRRLNETLEQRIADAVAQRMKAEEALRQAQKMEAIGQLTGGVAHDFNNLLQIVLRQPRHLEAPPRQSRDAHPQRHVSCHRRGDCRGAARRHAHPSPAGFLATPAARTASARGQPAGHRHVGAAAPQPGRKIAIETVLAGGLWRVFADPNQLESAVLNLAVNARDAMPDGGKLTIETSNTRLDEAYAGEQPEVRAGQYVMLAISDTGIGMTKEVHCVGLRPVLHDQGASAHGTGLGLSQVYGFVKQSDGHVKIYSEPGEGTTVQHLPAAPRGRRSSPTRYLSPIPHRPARPVKSSCWSRTTRRCASSVSSCCRTWATQWSSRPTATRRSSWSRPGRTSGCCSPMSACRA